MVKWAGSDTDEIGVSLSDIHAPYQDDKAVSSAINLIRALKPHRVVLNGDINDFFQLSRFNTGLHRIDELQNEIDAANEIRRRVRGAAPDAVFDETEGNHDNRVRSYVMNNARALVSLRALEPGNLFLYDELEIQWHPGAGFRIRPEFMVKHGTIVRAEAAASAKGEHLLSGISGISGHTHRLATWRRSGYVQRQWTEQGCLCRTDPDYVTGRPNWTQGCVVYEISKRTGSFVVHEVPFVDGSLRFGGRSF